MTVRSLFTFAIEQRWVKHDPFSRIDKHESVQTQPIIISRDQLLNKILSNARNATLYTIYLVGGDSGLRISKILNLQPEYLDFEEEILTFPKGKGDKTQIIPMSKRLVTELKIVYRERLTVTRRLLFFHNINDKNLNLYF